MKRWTVALALAAAMLLSGCSAKNVEAQAYAVSMGLDLTGDERIKVSVQVPTLNQSGSNESGESDQSGGGKGYTLSSAEGDTLTEALEMLNASVPRELNLTGVKSIVVSERLARSARFSEALHEISLAYRVYGAAEIMVCRGEADAFIRNQQPVIGFRFSESTTVALDHYQEYGYIPSAKTADVYYLSRSIYGDPVTILASGRPESGTGVSGADSYAGSMPGNGSEKNQYFGTALMSGGRMVGMLNGRQTQLLNVLLGNVDYFSWIVDGIPVRINLSGRPEVRMALDGEVTIDVGLTFNMMESEGKLSEERLREKLQEGLEALTSHCQACGCDPFRYAERAAGFFLTVEEWLEYDWRAKFPNAEVRYDVKVRRIDL